MTSIKDAPLKPCPFCGSPADIEPWHGGAPTKHMISCSSTDCEVSPGVTGETKDEAIKHWSTRALSQLTASPDRDKVARVIDPAAFENWQGLYDYGDGDDEDVRRRRADYFHKADCDKALAAADRVIAILSTIAPDEAAIRADERERCAKIAERDSRSTLAKEVGYEPDFYKHARFIAAAIRSQEAGR